MSWLARSSECSSMVQTKPSNGSTVSLAIIAVDRVNADEKRPQIFHVASTFDSAFFFHDLITKIGKYTGVTTGIVSQDNKGK